MDFIEILLEHRHIICQINKLIVDRVSKFFDHIHEIVHLNMNTLQSLSYNKIDVGIINWDFDLHAFAKFLLKKLIVHTDEWAVARMINRAGCKIWWLSFDGTVVTSTVSGKARGIKSVLVVVKLTTLDATIWSVATDVCEGLA